MTDTSGIDPNVTPAQAQGQQPAPNERPLSGGEQLQKAVREAVLPDTGLNVVKAVRHLFAPLPAIYDGFSKARAAGYSWDDIYEGYRTASDEAIKSGYTQKEVNDAAGLPTLDATPGVARPVPPPPSAFEQGGIPGEVAGPLRDFAAKYLTPRDLDIAAMDFKPTATGILKDLGWNVVDIGKMFGSAVVDGAAATAEMFDGRPRTAGDWGRLGLEASQFLTLFLPGPKGAKVEGRVAAEPPVTLPAKEDMLDAATALAGPKGLSDQGITDHARALGDHFVQTGEHPVEAVERAQSDPAAMQHLQEQAEEIGAGRAGQAPEPTEVPISEQTLNASAAPDPVLHEQIDPVSIRDPASKFGPGIVDDLQRIFAPGTRAREATGVIREGLATSERTVLQAADQLRRFGRAVSELPPEERRAWRDAYETGDLSAYKGTPMGDLGKSIHAQFDALYSRMEALEIAPAYVENYLPHLYQNPDGVAKFFNGRRSLEGAKAFTKARTYDLISEAEDAGFKLVTDDPVELALIGIRQQSKYISAHEIIQELNLRGLVGKTNDFHGQLPSGLTRIEDPMFNKAGYSAYAPDKVATLLNRLLSPGFSGRPVYNTLASASAFSAQIKLIGSLFHPFVVAADAIAGQSSLGMRQLYRGAVTGAPLDIGRGLTNIGTAPAAPFISAYRGSRYINEAIRGPGAKPLDPTIVDALFAAGARVSPSAEHMATGQGSFLRAFRGTLSPSSGLKTFGQEWEQMVRDAAPVKIGNTTVLPAYVRALGQGVGRAMDTVSAPIMDVLVPHMKVGAIAGDLEDMLRAHPNMTRDEIRIAGGRIVDQVDNRLGEMINDHLFWDKGVTDLNRLMFLAPNWFIGKLRLLGSAGIDLLSGGTKTIAEGEAKELSANITYVAGALAATAYMSSAYGYLRGTWNKDWEWRDYLFPPNPDGTRVTLPSVTKEFYGWTTNPLHELPNKLNVLPHIFEGLLTNEQYNGAAIHDPRAPLLEQADDYATFLAQQFAPIIAGQGAQDNGITPFERFLGIGPAPYDVREPERADRFEQRDLKTKLRKKSRMENR